MASRKTASLRDAAATIRATLKLRKREGCTNKGRTTEGFMQSLKPVLAFLFFAIGIWFDSKAAFARNLFVSGYDSGNIYEYTPGGSQSTFLALGDSAFP